MDFAVIFFIFSMFFVVRSERHTLEYIYTALSRSVDVPGVYEFTAMGLLDNKQIDYYNSKDKIKIPRQMWMLEKLDRNYWDKGTLSRRSKEQWFKVNLNILIDRMKHNKSDIHVLQWRHGCEGVSQPDGTLQFHTGFDQYSYDGGDFLSFDQGNSQWVAPVRAAESTKRKWDASHELNQYTNNYLTKECMDWLSKFMEYGELNLKGRSPPKVYTHSKRTNETDKVILHCLATGFYPKDVEVDFYRSGIRMTDGVQSTGVRPCGFSEDGTVEETYRLKKSVKILKSDLSSFECRVSHRTLDQPIVKKFELESEPGLLIVGVVIGIIAVIAVIALCVGAVFWYRKYMSIKGSCSTISKESAMAPLTAKSNANGQASGDSSSSSSDSSTNTIAISMPNNGSTNGGPAPDISPEEKKLLENGCT